VICGGLFELNEQIAKDFCHPIWGFLGTHFVNPEQPAAVGKIFKVVLLGPI
jgi:hypothetical protein